MAYALVNSSSIDNFTGAASTTLSTPAYSLTAGNLSIVVGRNMTGTFDITAPTCTDTAGNTYLVDGQVGVAQGLGFLIWSATNCLGHAANVVTVTYPSNVFTSVSALQFSGTTDVTFDTLTGVYVGSGAAISCVPTARTVLEQIVIVGSDVGNSRGVGSTVLTPSATFTHVHGSIDPVGPGHGSHDVWYNINATRLFDGSVTVTATYDNEFGNWANYKTIFATIYSVPMTPGEAIFTAGGISGPLAWLELTLKTEPT